MTYSDKSDLFKTTLDNLGKDYSSLLLRKYFQYASDASALDVQKLMRIDEEMKRCFLRNRNVNVRGFLVSLLLAFFFLLLCFLSLLGGHFSEPLNNAILSEKLFLPLCASFCSLLLIGLIFLHYTTFRIFEHNRRRSSRIYAEYQVIDAWRSLETICAKNYMPVGSKKYFSVIECLKNAAGIDNHSLSYVKKLLKMRNVILHNEENLFPISEIEDVLLHVDKIIQRLE